MNAVKVDPIPKDKLDAMINYYLSAVCSKAGFPPTGIYLTSEDMLWLLSKAKSGHYPPSLHQWMDVHGRELVEAARERDMLKGKLDKVYQAIEDNHAKIRASYNIPHSVIVKLDDFMDEIDRLQHEDKKG